MDTVFRPERPAIQNLLLVTDIPVSSKVVFGLTANFEWLGNVALQPKNHR